jgi:hypothetical protein
MTRLNIIKTVLFALIALPLAACGSSSSAKEAGKEDGGPGAIERFFSSKDKRNPAPCPYTGILADTSRLVEFRAPGERYANVGFTGEITRVAGLCEYYGDRPIEMNLDIDMAFGRGPMAANEEKRVYRYWVTVTRTNVAPIAKQYFDVEVRFPKGESVVRHTEKIKKIVIPRANANVAGTSFEILVGFDLTPEQLAFNRAGKRFTLQSINASQ